jgi:heme A synthase
MSKRDYIMFVALAVLAVVALITVGVLTLVQGSEYVEFGIVLVLFVVILLGSYLYVVAPQKQREERESE